jgi:hypothetical protein
LLDAELLGDLGDGVAVAVPGEQALPSAGMKSTHTGAEPAQLAAGERLDAHVVGFGGAEWVVAGGAEEIARGGEEGGAEEAEEACNEEEEETPEA